MIDPAPWRALGAELAAARHRTARTQQQLARQLGISQAAYSQFERGIVRPRPALLGWLAIVLGADVAHLAALANYPLAQVLQILGARDPYGRPLVDAAATPAGTDPCVTAETGAVAQRRPQPPAAIP
jgi:transcriptional regulator with XRE-family HTH domain